MWAGLRALRVLQTFRRAQTTHVLVRWVVEVCYTQLHARAPIVSDMAKRQQLLAAIVDGI
jgi:hypothetical protein